jgi:hypothetical protein
MMSGALDLTNDKTSDLLNLRRLTSEFAFQQQIDRMLMHSANVATALEIICGSLSRSLFLGAPAAGLKNRSIRYRLLTQYMTMRMKCYAHTSKQSFF